MPPASTANLADLRQQIEGIERLHARARTVLPFTVPEIDGKLPGGGLALGALHEIAGGANGAVNGAAAVSFAAGIAGRTGGKVLWCYTQPDLFVPALEASGLSQEQILLFEAPDEATLLGACEYALKHGSVSAVVGEMAGLSRVNSQRLQLAAETTGTMALAVRRWRRHVDARDFGNQTAAFTRWRITELPSSPLPVRGIGRSRWMLELMRARGGYSADFEVEACDDKGLVAIPADLANGSVQTDTWQHRAAR